jgi:hypothetical protein
LFCGRESDGLRYEPLFIMRRISKPRAGNSYERSELKLDADSPYPHNKKSRALPRDFFKC